MSSRLTTMLLSGLIALVLIYTSSLFAQNQNSNGAATDAVAEQLPDIPAEQIQSLVKDLQDPAAREKLIQQLTALTQLESTNDAPESEVQDATTELLQTASNELKSASKLLTAFTESVDALPQSLNWVNTQFQDPTARALWSEVLLNLLLVLGAGYLAYFILHGILLKPRKSLAKRSTENLLVRVFLASTDLLLALLPILAFAAAAYFTLGYIDTREQTRLVALAWINAALITRVIVVLGRLLFAPNSAELRFLPVTDATAQYAIKWIRRLAFTTVYGYFGLQTALLLGLPAIVHAALFRVLGLLITILVIVFIIQNRTSVADVIRGKPSKHTPEGVKALRPRLAQLWAPLAVFYVLILYGVWALEMRDGFAYLLRATVGTILVLVATYFVLNRVDQFFARDSRTARYTGVKVYIHRYLPILKPLLRGLVCLVVIASVLQIWGLNVLSWLASEPSRVLGSTAFTVAAIVLVSLIIWEFASSWIEDYLAEQERRNFSRARSNRMRTLLTVARNVLLVVLLVGSMLMILAELGVNIAPLLAGAGVLGLAVGFGAQKLVQDIITGFLILFEDMIAVGDVIEVSGQGGLVEAVSIRNVRLRDLSGTVHIIPFSNITTISNLTKDFSYYLMDVGIAYREDTDYVTQVLRELGAELQEDPQFASLILEPLEILGVDAFADSAVIIKARIKTQPIQQWNVGREFNRRMKKRFDELGIEIPFPHQTLYFGVDKQGDAPAARVQIDPNPQAQTMKTALEIVADK